LTGKGNEMCLSSKEGRYSIREGNMCPSVEK
jgi:hypothetical protein